jgi:DNA-directed RNA polymerase subunit RPC12/RpoP
MVNLKERNMENKIPQPNIVIRCQHCGWMWIPRNVDLEKKKNILCSKCKKRTKIIANSVTITFDSTEHKD